MEDLELEADQFELYKLVKVRGKNWVARELLKYVDEEEKDFVDNLRKENDK